MLSQLFPQHADNAYHGRKLALWIFALVVFIRAFQGLNSCLNARTTARYADGIPLHTYSSAAEQTVASLFSLLGWYSFITCLVCVLVLLRYRSLVPIMFVLLLLQSLGGRLIPHVLPIIRIGTPPGVYVNWILLAVMMVGLALSIRW